MKVYLLLFLLQSVLSLIWLKEEEEDMNALILSLAFRDMILKVPANHVAFILDAELDDKTITVMSKTFFRNGMSVAFFTIHKEMEGSHMNHVIEDMKKRVALYTDGLYVFIGKLALAEDIMGMINEEDFARRNMLYFFFIGKERFSRRFFSYVHEATRVCLVTNPRYGILQVMYNQATGKEEEMKLVNWWSTRHGVFRSPLLPSSHQVYRHFHGRLFKIPILHKPPWNFVTYNNDSIIVEGGRDDQLLSLLSKKLNFKYEYMDPPDRTQGSTLVNGSMQGALGLIARREVDMFLGDLTVTYERSLAVDFSFLTLTDSEAFLTHAPGRLNEALALLRPFNWEVWPAVLATFFLAGPLLYLFSIASNDWKPHDSRAFYDSIWVTTSIFLKQNIHIRLHKTRVRLLVTLLYLVSTYVIGDMYSANLTSMLAKPAREKPVSTLDELKVAMDTGLELVVEKHSASHSTLENGSGLYQSIWRKMQSQQIKMLDSTEEGILLVKKNKKVALIGGSETFFYNIRRFGTHHFHLSEKLFTRYSAIALQIGCPYIHNINQILMMLFEAGILTKITEDEYKKLGDKGKASGEVEMTERDGETKVPKEEDKKLKAMSMKMLQGAFYVLLGGQSLAGLAFFMELAVSFFQIYLKKCLNVKTKKHKILFIK